MTTQAPPLEDYDPTKDLSHYKRPTFDLLDKRESSEVEINMEEQAANKKLITETLKNYNIGIFHTSYRCIDIYLLLEADIEIQLCIASEILKVKFDVVRNTRFYL